MNALLKISSLAVVVAMLGGCFGGSGGSGEPRPDPAVDFTAFVKTQIGNTNNTRAAVQINDKEFNFNDQNNEQAFDDLFIQ
ncbi:hypothetical protein [Marinobacter sp.]|jgi:hypothetical protein|uniref:hypothetical protein n=1 Tax=Marinobacter sp. TaxID=50741 RepID=UPI000C35419A|nr:hypothetical protein [Marinobacter sp.]MBE94165.1 hypothetical protein [Marinobacter sp.]MBP53025.1 hypothetical protein [Marinobacter sp.]|tara:strand:+ start:896 stop:1138 length:243 start_codon:yes stop_codon:yes gene_type:complete